MAASLDDIRVYCKLDEDQCDDDELQGYADAAVAYLDNAGIEDQGADDALYNLAQKGLVCHWWENRNAIAYYRSEIPLGVRSVINQLKGRGGNLV